MRDVKKPSCFVGDRFNWVDNIRRSKCALHAGWWSGCSWLVRAELDVDTLEDTASTMASTTTETAPAYPEANEEHGGFAPGVTIGKVSAYQVMETKLANNGNEPNNTQIPLVADRDALVRVFLEPSETSPLEVYGELTLERNGEVEVLQRTDTPATSTDEKMGSMNFDVPASWVGSGVTVQLFDAALDGGGLPGDATWSSVDRWCPCRRSGSPDP